MKFSIITPAYNRAALLPKAIESVLGQSWQNWEYIIVDDGSTDNTRDVVNQFQDPRIRYIYQENKERSAARNKGISLADGDFITFLDSDDYYLSNHLEQFAGIISKHPAFKGFIYASGYNEANGIRTEKIWKCETGKHPAECAFFSFFLCNGVCITRSVLDEFRFKETMNVAEDINLWVRILMKYPLLQAPLLTHVQVDHSGRGGDEFFENPRMDRVETYNQNLEDLFINHGLGRFASREKWIRNKQSRYKLFALTSIWNFNFSEAHRFIRKFVGSGTSKIFSSSALEILKEYLIYRFLKKNKKGIVRRDKSAT